MIDIDEIVEKWHKGELGDAPLWVHLNMTKEEYYCWLEKDLHEIRKEHHLRLYARNRNL